MIDTLIFSLYRNEAILLDFYFFEINFIVFSVPLFRSKPIVQCDNDRDRNDMKGSKRHGNGHQIYSKPRHRASFCISPTILQTNREKRRFGLSKERSDIKNRYHLVLF